MPNVDDTWNLRLLDGPNAACRPSVIGDGHRAVGIAKCDGWGGTGGATLESLGLKDQEAVGMPLGYSLQCRITCEDPAQNFQVPAPPPPSFSPTPTYTTHIHIPDACHCSLLLLTVSTALGLQEMEETGSDASRFEVTEEVHCVCYPTQGCQTHAAVCCCRMQPDTGRIQAYRSPGGPGIRLDGAIAAGNVVSRYYDSLLVKASWPWPITTVCDAHTEHPPYSCRR